MSDPATVRETGDLHLGDMESSRMLPTASTLTEQIAARVLQSTHGRIRNLSVEDVSGHVFVRGEVPSHHTRQLALHGALELISGDQCSAMITVG